MARPQAPLSSGMQSYGDSSALFVMSKLAPCANRYSAMRVFSFLHAICLRGGEQKTKDFNVTLGMIINSNISHDRYHLQSRISVDILCAQMATALQQNHHCFHAAGKCGPMKCTVIFIVNDFWIAATV